MPDVPETGSGHVNHMSVVDLAWLVSDANFRIRTHCTAENTMTDANATMGVKVRAGSCFGPPRLFAAGCIWTSRTVSLGGGLDRHSAAYRHLLS